MMTLQERVHKAKPKEQWPLNKLHHVLTVRRNNKNKGMIDDNLLSLSYGRIVNKSIDTSEGLLPESFETYQIVQAGDIVMRLTDLQNDKRSIRQGLVKEKGIITSAYDAVYPRKGHDSRFWAYALLALDLAKYYYSLGGGVRQSIKFKDFPNDWIYTPPTETQKEIADFLDREITRIDQLIEKKEKLNQLLNEKRKNTISSAVLGLDTPFSGYDREEIKLKFVVDIISQKLPYGSIDATYIGLEHIRSWTGEIIEENDAQPEGLVSKFKSGEVLFGKLRPNLAKAALPNFDGVCSTEFLVLRPRKTKIDAAYLRYCLSEQTFIEDVVGSTYGAKMPRASWEFIGSRRLLLPDLGVQSNVAQQLNSYTKSVDKLINISEQSIKSLENFKISLITEAVTGQLDINSWKKRGNTDKRLDNIEEAMRT